MKRLLAVLLILVLAAAGVLTWDVLQLRALRPPDDRTFDGFVRAGREGSLLLDAAAERLYWTAPPRKTFVRYSDHLYEFDRSGQLVNWTPGAEEQKGMILDRPVRKSGKPVTVDDARAWMRRK
jgi:hypothetical protein